MFNSFKYLVDSVSTVSDYEEVVELFFGMIILVFLFLSIQSIGKALVFKKAGERWWKAFIPVYSEYTLCKISGTNYMWLILQIIGYVLAGIDEGFEPISDLFSIGYTLILAYSLSKSFGRSGGVTVGLIMFPALFYFVLAGRSSNYLGPVGCNDPIFKNVSFGNTKNNSYTDTNNTNVNVNNYTMDTSQNVSSNSVDVQNGVQYCYSCGHKLTEFDRFCPGCGREL